ncbi:MAG: hypothetical protein EZS28_008233 [Streblomastix strix]|uniref:Uncharacterized protein n=1 Tax=Streblomastix strix TaxID=222440 RepID=A0A5J4WMD3_9EUKA|nr:MAG: hypothetical protein EZS28_008233 [Streblomastix strix]
MRSNTTMSASSSRSQLDQLSLDKPFLARMSHLRNDWFEPVFDGIQHIHPNTDIGPHPERESLSKTLRELQEFQNYQQNKQEVETTSITSVPGQSQHPPIQIQPPQNAQSTGNQQQQTQNQTIVQSSYLKADEQHELTEEEKQILLRRQQMKQQILKRTPRRDTRVHVRSDGLIVGPGAFIDEKVAAINSIETLLTNLRSAANDLSYDVEREIFDDNNSRTSNETSRRQRSEYNQMNYDGDDSQGKGGGVPHWVKKGLNNSVVSDEDQRPPLDLLRPQSNSPWLKQSVNDTQQWSTWRKRGKDTTFLLDTEPFIPLPRIQQISPNHSPPLLFEQTIQPEMLFSKFSRNSLGMRTSFQQQVDRYEAIAAEIDELRQTLEQSSSQQGNDKEKAKRELLYHSYQGLIEELRKMNEYLTFRMQRTTKGKTKTNTKTNRNKSNRSVVYSSPVISAIPTMQRQNSNWYELKGDAFTVAHKEFLLQLKDEERKILEKKGYYDELARLQQ